ncbi:N-acetylmuramoyl-L-alanine amidase LytC precursor [Oxobacter pfennigii]|uniref:N-acetylmuramoyl-L-alanine amidase LytC n=1 Tax=Oxobacter pfennigii TaxID=36849 RepID=A0A0P8X413_9CLOT|nr:cell wall-binding repeat-containing protein [Oxobacter pfennigii]KPU45545.1 N-acetylmuramoyl-L-alanine amidase LytC precursor [Oxobacter pfennigii]
MRKLKTAILTTMAVIVLFSFIPGVSYAYTGVGIINCEGYLNVRQEAGTYAEIIDKLYPGTQINITDKLDNWYKVDIGGKIGWVFGDYVYTDSDTNFKRVQGTDRYATALEISKAGWQSSESVVIATGEAFPDALSAAPLAKLLDAPILLTPQDSLTTETINEIKRLGVKKAYLIGGQGVISLNIETSLLTMGMEVDRTYGLDRYETSEALAAKFFKEAKEAVIVTGENFPDAISIAPAAAAKEIPILLTAGDALSQNMKSYIESAGIENTYIAGGTGAVSSGIEALLPNPKRLGGMDRYETNTGINNFFADILNSSTTYIATGENYPDALAGSVMAAKNLSPVILIGTTPIQAALEFVNNREVDLDKVQILGGDGAVSNSSVLLLLASRHSQILRPPTQQIPSNTIKGIDVSRYQGDIDWKAVKDAGYEFAIIRISGVSSNGLFTDVNAIKNVNGAKAAGLVVGGYHYAYFKNAEEAQEEANYFVSIIKDMGLKYAVLDIEYPGAKGDLTQASLKFLDTVSSVAQPVLYSYPLFIDSHLTSKVTKYPLWIAHYGVSSPKVPVWPEWKIWQMTSQGSVPGIKGNVDINIMKPEFFKAN